MSRKSIPIYFDSEKDKELWEWLHNKNGMANFIRTVLFEKMLQERINNIPNKGNETFTKCMMNFIGDKRR